MIEEWLSETDSVPSSVDLMLLEHLMEEELEKEEILDKKRERRVMAG